MKTIKTFFLRTTALFTAVALMLTGILDYAFAITIGDDALLLSVEDGDVTDFYLTMKDKNGKGVMIGLQGGQWIEIGTGEQMKAEDVDFMSLAFTWKAAKFNTDQVTALKENGGMLKFEIGAIKGFEIEGMGTRDNPAVSTNDGYNAKYWIENGALYIQLDEGAYKRDDHKGGFTFKGKLGLQEVKNNNNTLKIGDEISYTFAEPPADGKPSIFAYKSANGYVTKDGDYYYQNFTVVVGRNGGDITEIGGDITIEEYLGDWFDQIDQVKINGSDHPEKTVYSIWDGTPIKIVIPEGTATSGNGEWGDYTVTFRARLKYGIGASQLAQYNYSDEGNNTIKAVIKTDDGPVESNESSAKIQVQTPTVEKTGALTEDESGNSYIIWRIKIKTTSISGENFKLSEMLTDLEGYSDIITLDDKIKEFFESPLSQDDLQRLASTTDDGNSESTTDGDTTDGDTTDDGNKVIVTYTENEDGTKEYYIEFKTPVKSIPSTKTDVKNTVSVTFTDIGKNFDSTATVPLEPEQVLFKELDSYVAYEPGKNNEDIVTWRIDYTIPADATGELKLHDEFRASGFSRDNPSNWFAVGDHAEIVQVVITDDYGNSVIADDDFRYELCADSGNEWVKFDLFIENLENYQGKSIHIRYEIEFDHQDIDYVLGEIVNKVKDETFTQKEVQVTETLPYYTTYKSAASNGAYSAKDGAADWLIYIESSQGYKAGDKIVITDIIPDGLALVKGSVSAGVTWNTNVSVSAFEAIPELQKEIFYTSHENGDGTTTCTFTLIIPDNLNSGRGFYADNQYGARYAIKYTTKLVDEEAYHNAIANAGTTFTNYASATVTPKDSDPIPSPGVAATFPFDPNENNNLLKKSTTATKDSLPSELKEGESLPTIPYEITVNADRADLIDGDTITLTDTLGKRLTVIESTISVSKVVLGADGKEQEVSVEKCWEYTPYNEETGTPATIVFNLEDNTKYVIRYSVDVDFPTLAEDSILEGYPGRWKKEDFVNTVQLSGIVTTEPADWVKYIQRVFYDSTTKTKYNKIALEFTKTWEGVTDFDSSTHQITVALDWEKRSFADDQVVAENGTGTIEETFTATTASNTFKFPEQTAVVSSTDDNSKLYYYVYTLKEIKVDGVELDETSYTVTYSSSGAGGVTLKQDGVEINCKELDSTETVNIKGIGIKNAKEPDPVTPEPEKISITLEKEWKDGDGSQRPGTVTFTLKRKTDKGEDVNFAKSETLQNNFGTYVFGDLEKKDSEGYLYTYWIEETPIELEDSGDSYTASYTDNEVSGDDGTIKVTNTLTGTTFVTVTKVWATGTAKLPAALQSKTVTLKITGSDGSTNTETVVLNYEDNKTSDETRWTHTFTGLRKYDDSGNLITYTVQELDDSDKPYQGGSTFVIGEDTYTVSYDDSTHTVTNTTDNITSVTVYKLWSTGSSGLPAPLKEQTIKIKLKLTGSDEITEETVELDYDHNNASEDGKTWSYTFDNLPKYASDGSLIKYTVQEVDADDNPYESGATVQIGGDSYTVTNNGLTVTNTLTSTTSVTVTKVWATGTAKLPAALQSKTVTLKITGSDGSTNTKTVVLNYKDNKTSDETRWTHTFTGLRKYDGDGNLITYTVREVDADSKPYESGATVQIGEDTFTVSYDDSTNTVTNTLDNITSVTVYKQWSTGSSGLPAPLKKQTITLKLTGSDGSTNTKTVVLDHEHYNASADGKTWSYTFDDLPKYADDGSVITYTVQEVDADDNPYESGTTVQLGGDSYTVTNNGLTVTNTLTSTTSITVTKIWDTGTSALPEALKSGPVQFKIVGSDESETSVTLNFLEHQTDDEKIWSHTFTGLRKYDDYGNLITYTIREVDENNEICSNGNSLVIGDYTYRVSYDDNTNTVTNELIDSTSVTVIKVWNTGDLPLPEALQSTSTKVKLLIIGDDGVTTKAVTLDFSHKTSDDVKTWSHTFTGLPKYSAGNELITYTVRELDENGDICESGNSLIIGGDTYEASYDDSSNTVTNKLINTTSVTVVKLWDTNTSVLPKALEGQKVTLKLTGNDGIKDIEETHELNYRNRVSEDGKTWSYTFTDLPKYASDGSLIEYTVEELGVDGNTIKIGGDTFTVSCDGLTVTNTLNNTTSIRVVKLWDTGDMPLPKAIKEQTVTLLIIGSVEGEPISDTPVTFTLTYSNRTDDDGKQWSDTCNGLPKYADDGNLITYTVKEDGEREGTVKIGKDTFAVSYDDSSNTVTNTLNNTTSVTVVKLWDTGDIALPTTLQTQTVTLRLTRNDGIKDIVVEDHILTYGNATDDEKIWSYTFTDLPKYDEDGEPIVYSVKELDADENVLESGKTVQIGGDTYTVSYDEDANTVTNTLNNTTSIRVVKLWDTGDSALPEAAEGHTVTLYIIGSVEGKPISDTPITVTLNSSNSTPDDEKTWSYTCHGLFKYDDDGKLITYTVRELDENGDICESGNSLIIGGDTYRVSYDDSSNTVTNKLVNEDDPVEEPDPGTPQLTVEKTQTANGKTDDYIQVKSGDTVAYSVKVTNSGDGEAADVVVTDVIPAGLTLEGEITCDVGTVDLTDGKITWTIDTLAADGTATLSYSVKVPDVSEGYWKNIATLNESEDTDEVVVEKKPEIPTTPPATPSNPTEPEPPEEEDYFSPDGDLPTGDQELPNDDEDYFSPDFDFPTGDQQLPTDDDDYFNSDEDGNPFGNMNMPTGVVVGGTAGLAAGSLIAAVAAHAAGKRRRGRKNKKN